MRFCMSCMAQYDDGVRVCPECGFEEGTQPFNSRCIEPGLILSDRYIVGMPLNIDSWFVKYIGYDALLERKVTVYEYCPARYCARNIGDTAITVLKQKEFYKYMERFVKKAQLLAQLHLPDNVSAVYEIFEKNNTTYVITQYAEGMPLSEYIDKNGAVSPEKTENMFLPVLRSIDRLNDSGFVIGGFSPDDLLVMEDGSLFLSSYLENALINITDDRTDIAQKERQRYFSYERLKETDAPSLAPACDVYSAALIMHRMMGVPIPEAAERDEYFEQKHKDRLKLISSYRIRIDSSKEAALRNASYVDTAFRTPDMSAFIKELSGDKKKVRIVSKKGPVLPLWAKITIPAVCAALVAGAAMLFIMKDRTPPAPERVIVTREELSAELTAVPSVIGLDVRTAQSRLEGSGLTVQLQGREVSETVSPDTVVSQSLSPGSIVERNSIVGLVLSMAPEKTEPAPDGSITLPDLTLKTRQEAEEWLFSHGLVPQLREEFSGLAAAGLVESMSPAAGSTVMPGESVELTVSKGGQPVAVPDLKGKDREEALRALVAAGLTPVVIYGDQNSGGEDGKVLDQSVQPRTQLSKGSPVMITVNSKEELTRTPPLIGLSKDEAADRLAELGLALAVYSGNSSPSEGFVSGQFPAAGSPVKAGGEVTVILVPEEQAKKMTVSPAEQKLSAGDEFVLNIRCENIEDLVSVGYELSQEGIIEPVYIDKQTLSMTFKALAPGQVTVTVTYGGIERRCTVEVT